MSTAIRLCREAAFSVHDVTTEAWLSLAVVAAYAVALTAIAIRAFERSAVK